MKEPWAMPLGSTNEVSSSTTSSFAYSSRDTTTQKIENFSASSSEETVSDVTYSTKFSNFLNYSLANVSILGEDLPTPALFSSPVIPKASFSPQVTIARSILYLNESRVEKNGENFTANFSANFSEVNQDDYFNYPEDSTTVNGTQMWEFGNFTAEKIWEFGTKNATGQKETEVPENITIITITTAVILAIMILTTVVGNVFVIAAILLERNLQSVANYLILSLAVADLLVAALVMPLGAVYEVSKEWTFGPELCDMWTVSDVLCCTASILHLVAIALDRYWAVTNVDYIQQRSPKRVGSMIMIIWVVSALISSAPLMGWKDSEWHLRIHTSKVCLVSQDLYYQVFATMTSFYLPLGVILILYWRIYQAARKRIRRKIGANTRSALLCRGAVAISETTTFTRVSSANGSPEKSSNGALNEEERNEEAMRIKMASLPLNPLALLGPRPPRKREMEARRERKAAKTLAVITGAFVMCWLPFFVMALLMPLCKSCTFSPYLVATLLWLGYFNSTLNPIIYTIFSPDFRHAFRTILCGKKRLRKRQFDSRVSSFKAAKS